MALTRIANVDYDMVEESFETPEVGSFLEELEGTILQSVEMNLRQFVEDQWPDVVSSVIAYMGDGQLDPYVEDELINTANNYSDLIIDKIMTSLMGVGLVTEGSIALDELKDEFMRVLGL